MLRLTHRQPTFSETGLQDVHRLLTNLLQFVLHSDYDFLDTRMICLRTCRIDFTAHLLDNESEFLSRILVSIDSVHEIFAMLAEAHLLFIDIKLLEIINHLFLETALVRLELKVGNSLLKFGSDSRNTLTLK